jgi:hypothetical protein
MGYSRNTFKILGKYSSRRLLLNKYGVKSNSVRYFGVVPILSRLLKLRYLFLGSAVGGGVAIHNVILIKKNNNI